MANPEHTPAPSPGRSYYGFVLYLLGWSALTAYLSWAFVPHHILASWGITYLPQAYWALALPSLIITAVMLFLFLVYPAINLTLSITPDDLRNITDSHSISPSHYTDKGEFCVPPVFDIPISEVCQTLYS